MASSQDVTLSVPLTYQHEQEGLRLVELPPEILETLSSPSTESPQIFLKSTPDNKSSSNVKNSSAGHVVLCTADKTYQLRQIQSSNTIFIMQPSVVPPPSGSDMDDSLPQSCMSIFATCGSVLEVSAAAPTADAAKQKDPAAWLNEMLDLYGSVDDLASPRHSRGVRSIREEFYADIPYSSAELDSAWTALCAFEARGRAFQPTPAVKLEVWSALFTEATADGKDLTQPTDRGYLLAAAASEGSHHPSALLDAVVARVTDFFSEEDGGQKVQLSKTKLVAWVGEQLLQRAGGGFDGDGAGITAFTEAWTSKIPEAWRGEVDTATVLRTKEQVDARSVSSKGEAKDAPPAAKKRDWHERLKRGRKA